MKDFKDQFDLADLALPWHEQLVMRLYMGPFVASSSNDVRNREIYKKFSGKVIDLASEIPFSQHSIPVLVPAQAGLLDDTRYWSISQTLEHLLKLDTLAKQIILKLAGGEEAGVVVTPAGVAPQGRMESEKVFEDYKNFVPLHLDEIDAALASSTSKLTARHPVFGDFTARQWYWSLGMRTSLRYRQLKNIRKGLTYDPPAERQISRRLKSPGV